MTDTRGSALGTLTRAVADLFPRRRSAPPARAALFDDVFVRKLSRLRLLVRRKRRLGRPGRGSNRNRGRGLDFVDHRAYVPGDDLRHLDWHLYARHERPLVRLYEAETDLAVHVLIDHSASMGFGVPSKLDLGVTLAGALAYLGLAQEEHVTLTAFTDTLEQTRICTLKARAHAFRQLAQLQAAGPTALAKVVRQFLARGLRPGLVIIISDFWDLEGTEQALLRLCASSFDVVLLRVLAAAEFDPSRDEGFEVAGDVVFKDAESGEELPLQLGPEILRDYAAALSLRDTALRNLCRRHRAALVTTLSHAPFEHVILKDLRRAGLAG